MFLARKTGQKYHMLWQVCLRNSSVLQKSCWRACFECAIFLNKGLHQQDEHSHIQDWGNSVREECSYIRQAKAYSQSYFYLQCKSSVHQDPKSALKRSDFPLVRKEFVPHSSVERNHWKIVFKNRSKTHVRNVISSLLAAAHHPYSLMAQPGTILRAARQ